MVRAVDHGLGKYISKLDAAQIDKYYKVGTHCDFP
jgi:hypothetical protein